MTFDGALERFHAHRAAMFNRLATVCGVSESPSGLESVCPDPLQQRPKRLISVGRGPQTQLWVLVRLQESPQKHCRESSDGETGQDKLFAAVFSILALEIRARMGRAISSLGARWRRTCKCRRRHQKSPS